MKLLAAACLLLLATPGLARAELASIVSRDLPVAGAGAARTPASATPRFNLVGLHWQGPGRVVFRTRGLNGRWSAWRDAAPEDEDRPDRASGESTRRGWNIGNPFWVGASDRIEYRLRGRVTRLRGHFVWSSAGAGPPARTLSVASSPLIVPRSSWGANELIKRGTPRYASRLSFAVVHHTAGANAYTREQSAAIVRAIQLYHVRGNGWNDIGYNFLVDKYGQVFEGRFGGVARNVVGAHAEGFNTGSTGVAVLGTYTGGSISPAARDAIVRLLAWRLDVAHLDPLAPVPFVSGGNGRFRAGGTVHLRTIIGHRDTGFTSCPGDALYRQLSTFGPAVAASGGPKLYAPAMRGRLGGPIRFTGRLSAPLPWAVTVTDRLGVTVASGAGTGTAVDWTWDAAFVPPGGYTWTIAAGPTVRPARGTIGARGGAAVLTLTEVAASPSAITPNGDGIDDGATISYTLGAAATVTGTLTGLDGVPLLTLFTESKSAGRQTFPFAADGIPDGTYRIVLSAVAGVRAATASVDVLVNRTLSGFGAARASFSPNADGRLDSLAFSFALAAPADVKLRILREGKWVATPFAGSLLPGTHPLTWDGSKRIGQALDGPYEAELTATGEAGTVSQRVPFAVDTRPATLGIITRRPVRVRVSEPAELVFWVGDRRAVVKSDGKRLVRLPVSLPASLQIWDASGNFTRRTLR